MTDNGKAVVETFRQMQKIYKQVSLLLTTANSLMAARQWDWQKSI